MVITTSMSLVLPTCVLFMQLVTGVHFLNTNIFLSFGHPAIPMAAVFRTVIVPLASM